jgi:hypothetical protein
MGDFIDGGGDAIVNIDENTIQQIEDLENETNQDPTNQDPTNQDPTNQDPTNQDPTTALPQPEGGGNEINPEGDNIAQQIENLENQANQDPTTALPQPEGGGNAINPEGDNIAQQLENLNLPKVKHTHTNVPKSQITHIYTDIKKLQTTHIHVHTDKETGITHSHPHTHVGKQYEGGPFIPIFSNSCNNYPFGTCYFRPWQRDLGLPCANPNITTRDLDWRRKVEILKYNQNQNKMTQKERFKRAATNTLTRRSKTFAYQNLNRNPKLTNPNSRNLPLNNGILQLPECGFPITYSTGADVPGPEIQLFPLPTPTPPLTRYPRERRTYRGGAEKWPQWGWYPGANGFPVGKKGNL